jgi:hypothetical protein
LSGHYHDRYSAGCGDLDSAEMVPWFQSLKYGLGANPTTTQNAKPKTKTGGPGRLLQVFAQNKETSRRTMRRLSQVTDEELAGGEGLSGRSRFSRACSLR